jgi:hypothetical protein
LKERRNAYVILVWELKEGNFLGNNAVNERLNRKEILYEGLGFNNMIEDRDQ